MIIMFGAEKGGVAKSRLSTNFAAYAASMGIKVVLLDTDRQGSSGGFVDLRRADPSLVAFDFYALPVNPAKEIAEMASRYELVVVDIGAQNYRTMLETAQLSDLIVVPCGADQSEIDSTLNTMVAVRKVAPAVETQVVLTRVPPGKTVAAPRGKEKAVEHRSTADARAGLESVGIPVFKSTFPSREAWKASGKTGRSVVELKGKERSDKAAKELEDFYKEVVALLSKKGE